MQLENFVKSGENKEIFAQIKQSVDKALEEIQIRVDWRKNNEEYVAELLDYYGNDVLVIKDISLSDYF